MYCSCNYLLLYCRILYHPVCTYKWITRVVIIKTNTFAALLIQLGIFRKVRIHKNMHSVLASCLCASPDQIQFFTCGTYT